MPIPSFPTCTPRSVTACDCCTLGSPAPWTPWRSREDVPDSDDNSIDDYLSDSFLASGPGGPPDIVDIIDEHTADETPISGDPELPDPGGTGEEEPWMPGGPIKSHDTRPV